MPERQQAHATTPLPAIGKTSCKDRKISRNSCHVAENVLPHCPFAPLRGVGGDGHRRNDANHRKRLTRSLRYACTPFLSTAKEREERMPPLNPPSAGAPDAKIHKLAGHKRPASDSMNFGRARRWPAGRRIRRGRTTRRTATSGRGFAQTAHGRDLVHNVSNNNADGKPCKKNAPSTTPRRLSCAHPQKNTTQKP